MRWLSGPANLPIKCYFLAGASVAAGFAASLAGSAAFTALAAGAATAVGAGAEGVAAGLAAATGAAADAGFAAGVAVAAGACANTAIEETTKAEAISVCLNMEGLQVMATLPCTLNSPRSLFVYTADVSECKQAV